MMAQLETTLENYDATNVELSNSESKLKPKQEVNDKMEHTIVSVCYEKFTIKEELLNVTEQQQEMDSDQHRLESTLDFKHYKVNTDLQIQREFLINKYKDSELKNVKNFSIKSEILDIKEQPEEADLQEPKPIMIIKESDGEGTINDVSNATETSEHEDPVVDKGREVCEAIKQEWKDLSVTPLIYRSNGLPFNKELRVVLEDVMLTLGKQNTQESFEEATNNGVSYLRAQSVKNKKKNTHPRREARTSTVNGKIDFTHYDAENVFICDICNKSYQKKKYLYEHIQGHLKFFKCTYCGYSAHSQFSLQRHINAKHTKNIVYNCSFCNYTGYYRNSVIRHENSQHTKKTIYNCSYCSYRAYDKRSLSNHENSQHTKNTVYNCSYCSYRGYDKLSLSSHENSQHTKNTVYNCSYCSYRTYNSSHLSTHVNSQHTKDTVYNCSFCAYKTFLKGNLNRHINTVHTKTDVFNCSYCDYKAYAKSYLNKHINCKHNKITI